MKYNVPLDLDTNNSLKLINDRILEGSIILEFGPANGRFTKYLNEKKKCQVDIVEIDLEAGTEASKYARRSLVGVKIGNIENYNWVEAFANEKYDYIIFADVLEHLYQPKKVLATCLKLLKDTGSILMSIPNIAHNSILLELLDNNFEYTKVGLLDDTHIRFFTYKTLNKVLNDLNLIPVYENATKVKVGSAQIVNEIPIDYNSFEQYNMEVIKNNDFGSCFQFIVEAKKNIDANKNIDTLNCLRNLKSSSQKKDTIFKDKVEFNTEILSYIDGLKHDILRASQKTDCMQRELDIVHNSNSWRITKPLRFFGQKMRQIVHYCQGNKTTVESKPVIFNQGEGYYSLYEDNKIIEHQHPSVKAIAFHLPQFHTFPENDQWWGKGFTEWTNVKKGRKRIKNHYQPRVPHQDIGYYKLDNVDALKKQVKMAQEHYIYGFCYYYYWFSGHRLMEKPLDILLSHPEIDIKYCLCWANENWTRTWDGLESNILIKQNYDEKDKISFIHDIKKYLMDKRYIRFRGKPVIIIYNIGAIPDIIDTLNAWKAVAKKEGIGDISIWSMQTFDNQHLNEELKQYIDREVEFPPHGNSLKAMMKGKEPQSKITQDAGYIYDYCDIVDEILKQHNEITVSHKQDRVYKTVMLGWDNSCRREKGYTIFDNFDLGKYYEWLKDNISYTELKFPPTERYTFINAWNEWAEGTYLEPDEKYGYAALNATTKGILKENFEFNIRKGKSEVVSKIAVQVHVFYENLIKEIINYTNNIDEPFDLFITTDSIRKYSAMAPILEKLSKAANIKIMITQNKGRDVAPFLMQMHDRIHQYKYFLHLHTKKSLHSGWGDEWRKYLFNGLLGSKEKVKKIIDAFENDYRIGIIYPKNHKNLLASINIGSNQISLRFLGYMLGIPFREENLREFPCGDMFWGRVDALKQIFEYPFDLNLFPKEKGQLDATIMHAVERWIR